MYCSLILCWLVYVCSSMCVWKSVHIFVCYVMLDIYDYCSGPIYYLFSCSIFWVIYYVNCYFFLFVLLSVCYMCLFNVIRVISWSCIILYNLFSGVYSLLFL